MKAILIYCSIFFIIVSAVHAQNIDDEVKKANSLYQEKKYDEAIALLSTILNSLVGNKQFQLAQKIQLNIASIYFEQKKFDLAAKELESARQKFESPDPGTWYNIRNRYAMSLYQLGQYTEAIEVWKSLQSSKSLTDDQKASIFASLGDCYRHDEMYRLAAENYTKSLSLYEKLKNEQKMNLIYTALGLSYNKIGEFQKAIFYLEKSIKASQHNNPKMLAESNSNLGIVYFDKGDFSKAKSYLDTARQVEEKFDLQRNLGVDSNNTALVLKSVGKYQESIEYIKKSIDLAQKVSNRQDEAIAWSNHALVLSIMGNYNQAFDAYQKSLGLYKEVSFDEGIASCYLGLGKLYEMRDMNYLKAYDYYQQALVIYERLENLGYQAETNNQIGRVLKKSINPVRTSQSYGALIFENDPVLINLPPDQAANKSVSAYLKALELGRLTMRQEVVWSALQGLGYALTEQGKLEDALNRYKEAVDTVISIRKNGTDSSLMADYLREKDDLFTEAIGLCARLYQKAKESKYIELQMEYQEIYNNEVIKIGMQEANLAFQDSSKQKLIDELKSILDQIGKTNQLIGQNQSYLNQKKKVKAVNKSEIKKEIEFYKTQSNNLEKQYQKMFAQLKSEYPQDAGLFESVQKINLKQIQQRCDSDTAYIQYLPTDSFLGIICITKEGIFFEKIDILYRELATIIRDNFSNDCIEVYGHRKFGFTKPFNKYTDERGALLYGFNIMSKLYSLLIKPIQHNIDGKKRLVIATSKYISYLPFEALTRSSNSNQNDYLIYDYIISYSRPSFWGNKTYDVPAGKKQKKPHVVLTVGNPLNSKLQYFLSNLESAQKEAEQVVQVAKSRGMKIAGSLIGKQATEEAWEKALKENSVSVAYFATHGVPAAEIQHYIKTMRKEIAICNNGPTTKECTSILIDRQEKAFGKQSISKWSENTESHAHEIYNTVFPDYSRIISLIDKSFPSKSYLNSFLYMADTDKEEGVLTLKKLLELPDYFFSNAYLAVLSACNTAVTYSPQITNKMREEFESDDITQNIYDSEFLPGVDQISLTETFMKRNFRYLIGTLWFADDKATGIIMSKFFENFANDQNIPEALRNAKLYYLTNMNNLMPASITKIPEHPFFWAVTSVFEKY